MSMVEGKVKLPPSQLVPEEIPEGLVRGLVKRVLERPHEHLLLTKGGERVGVLLSVAEYELLVSAAGLASDPSKLLAMMDYESRLYREGVGDSLSLEEAFPRTDK